jgi:hypothetical protein
VDERKRFRGAVRTNFREGASWPFGRLEFDRSELLITAGDPWRAHVFARYGVATLRLERFDRALALVVILRDGSEGSARFFPRFNATRLREALVGLDWPLEPGVRG